MEFAKMKKQLLQLQEKDYQNFVKALVSIETKCDDEEKLKDMYEDFMEDDTMGLLDIAPEENFPELTIPDDGYKSLSEAIRRIETNPFSDTLGDYQTLQWLKELRKLRSILNRPDKTYNPNVSAFESLEDAIDSFDGIQSASEIQVLHWLKQLKRARDVATNNKYNGDEYEKKQLMRNNEN